jgi:hypothetical protein
MVKLLENLDEGRSKNRYLHTVSNAFASYVLDFLKKNPLVIQQTNYSFKPTKFLSKEQKKLLPKLKNITIFFVKEPDVYKLIQTPEATYYGDPEGSEETYGGSTYEFEKGEIDIKFLIDDSVESFEQLKDRYNYLYGNMSELFRHEVQHYVDDQALEKQGGLSSLKKERSPYHFLTDQQKEKFNYFARPYEVKAYVTQFMEEAKRLRRPFYKVLVDYLKTNEEFSMFNSNPKLKDILYVLIYKYLERASTMYNSVREDESAMKYLQKLGAFLDDKGLYTPEEDMSETYNHDKFKDWLVEGSALSKYWKKRAKSRAKRAGRKPNNAIDKNWALEQESKSKDISVSLKKTFDEQIKESEALSKQIEEIIALQAKKKKNLSKDPFVSGITGRMKGFKQKHKGAKKIAPGEAFGPLEEEENETN